MRCRWQILIKGDAKVWLY